MESSYIQYILNCVIYYVQCCFERVPRSVRAETIWYYNLLFGLWLDLGIKNIFRGVILKLWAQSSPHKRISTKILIIPDISCSVYITLYYIIIYHDPDDGIYLLYIICPMCDIDVVQPYREIDFIICWLSVSSKGCHMQKLLHLLLQN